MSEVEINMRIVPVGPLDVNCYIIWDSKKRGVVIDAGGDADRLKSLIDEESLDIRYLLNTHGHFDHIGGITELKDHLGVPFGIHREDHFQLKEAVEHGRFHGLEVASTPVADMALEDGMAVEVSDELVIDVIHTPGHTKGGVCFYLKDSGILITGDTLFAGSVGRTDLPGGDYNELMDSLKDKLMSLPGDVSIYPGHGPASTIDMELKTNPFMAPYI